MLLSSVIEIWRALWTLEFLELKGHNQALLFVSIDHKKSEFSIVFSIMLKLNQLLFMSVSYNMQRYFI